MDFGVVTSGTAVGILPYRTSVGDINSPDRVHRQQIQRTSFSPRCSAEQRGATATRGNKIDSNNSFPRYPTTTKTMNAVIDSIHAQLAQLRSKLDEFPAVQRLEVRRENWNENG